MNPSQLTIRDSYAFGRERSETPILDKETGICALLAITSANFNEQFAVIVLKYPFEPLVMLPAAEGTAAAVEEYKKCFADAKVYLVGTAHFSTESQQDVTRTIRATQPDIGACLRWNVLESAWIISREEWSRKPKRPFKQRLYIKGL